MYPLMSPYEQEKIDIKIMKPKNAVYLFNTHIINFPVPFIVGTITIHVTASYKNGIEYIELSIPGSNQLFEPKGCPPYQWTWDKRGGGQYTIEATAYSTYGVRQHEKVMVWKFF